jgi:hypothetical protein
MTKEISGESSIGPGRNGYSEEKIGLDEGARIGVFQFKLLK